MFYRVTVKLYTYLFLIFTHEAGILFENWH